MTQSCSSHPGEWGNQSWSDQMDDKNRHSNFSPFVEECLKLMGFTVYYSNKNFYENFQGNILRGIFNWSGAAWSVAPNHFFIISNRETRLLWNSSEVLQVFCCSLFFWQKVWTETFTNSTDSTFGFLHLNLMHIIFFQLFSSEFCQKSKWQRNSSRFLLETIKLVTMVQNRTKR